MSNFWEKKYEQAEPIPAKYLHADGTIDENSGATIDAYTKEETDELIENIPGKKFTYIVNSDASLQYWLTNKASGTSSGGDDFTSVLIKKGTYSVNYSTANLSDIGTEYVEGETGNCINNYNILFHDMTNYSGYDPTYCFENLYIVNHLSAGPTIKAFRMVRGIHNCRVDGSATDASTATAFGCYTFDTCYDISEVIIRFTNGSSFNDWQQGLIAGFNSCQRLSNCAVTSDWNVTSGSSSSIVYGFISCVDVTNCRVSAYKMGHGIGSCKRVLHCAVVGYSITDKYGSSYASDSATSTYACADTANGGFNV